MHEILHEWAASRKIKFAPHKYRLMHFRKPTAKEPVCTLLPEIPQMVDSNPNVDSILVQTEPRGKSKLGRNRGDNDRYAMRILGVWVDPQLTWRQHVAQIRAKVVAAKSCLFSYSGGLHGPNL